MSAQIDFNLYCMAITLPDKSHKSLLNKSFKIVLRATKILKKKNEISFKDLKKIWILYKCNAFLTIK